MIIIFSHVDAFRKDDWDAAQIKITRVQTQDKDFYYQSYVPKNEYPQKKPFVVIIQDEFMKNSS